MNDARPPRPGDQTSLEPQSTTAPSAPSEGAERGGEHWLERLRAGLGLGRSTGSFRADLATALAKGDGAEDAFTPAERSMLGNILRLRELRVDDVMVPRADIEAVAADIRLDGLLHRFQESGHSRMPVYRDTLDEPLGMVHIKDLMVLITRAATLPPAAEGEAPGIDLARVDLARSLGQSDLVRKVLFVPPSMPAAALLASMQANRVQMALVIDEYGGTDGLVSIEDLVETVVGDIEDEHDDDEAPMITSEADGSFLADARADLEEVEAALGTRLATEEDSEEVDTIGGLVSNLAGRVPVRGELVEGPDGWEFEVLDADPRRIKRLRIARPPADRRRARPPGSVAAEA